MALCLDFFNVFGISRPIGGGWVEAREELVCLTFQTLQDVNDVGARYKSGASEGGIQNIIYSFAFHYYDFKCGAVVE